MVRIAKLPSYQLAVLVRSARLFRVVTLAAIVISSVALSLFWARLVPIFEAPDEPTHYDYIVSIARAGHLIRERDALTAYYANPDVFAALLYSQQPEVAFHPRVQEPRGYGDRDYYARLDEAVASASSTVGAKRNPWIMTIYPFGYYALAAIWLRIGECFTSSFSALFFWVRALSSVMLGGTLLMSFVIVRRLGLGALRSLAIVGVMGLLPLTSFVSSYVQPDNLAWLLVTAVWLAAIGLADRPSLSKYAILGVLAGLLLDTKVQFFLAAAIGVAPYLFVKLHVRSWREALMGSAVTIVPIAMFAAVQLWVSSDSREHVLQGEHLWASSDAFWAAYAEGARSIAVYVIAAFRDAFLEYFVNGRSFQSFWGIFGWMDTPLTFGSQLADVVISTTIVVVTMMTLALAALWLVRHASDALGAMRRDPRAALRSLFGDPVVPTYMSFVAIMFAIYVYLHNTFGAQGRNWLPLILPMLIIATQRLFKGRFERPGTIVMTGMLIAYAVLGCVCAPLDLVSRYYADAAVPARPLAADEFPFTLSESRTLADISPLPNAVEGGTIIEAGDHFAVAGWAVDSVSGAEPYGVFISIDDQLFIPTVYGEERPDVAKALGDSRYLRSGFIGSVDTGMLSRGHHTLFLRVASSSGRFAYRSTVSKEFVIQ